MRRLLVLLLAMLGVTCTFHRVQRPVAEGIETSATRIQQDPLHRQHVAARSLELHATSNGNFDLAVIEFDDQGWLWNPDQLQLALQTAERAASGPGALIVAFFHGWKNNAAVCNRNLVCFRDALSLLDRQEREIATRLGAQPRRVVGIYPAWRGLSTKIGRNLSFWGRKETAHRIGRAGVVDLVAELDDLHRRATVGPQTRLVFIGHSFGAALLYEATASVIRTSLVSSLRHREPSGCQPLRDEIRRIRSVGDLMVLVNPAFEASLYHEVDLRSHWFDNYSRLQTPVLMTVSSEADLATRFAFPAGRTLSTIAQKTRAKDQRDAVRESLGNYDPFFTHTLKLNRPSQSGDSRTGAECQCPVNLESVQFELPAAPPDPCALHLAETRQFGDVTLEKDPHLNSDNPFNVVTAAKDIITSHTGIFTRPFFEFLVRYVGLIDAKKRASASRFGVPAGAPSK